MKESCRKVHQKLVPDPFLILVNKPKNTYCIHYILKKDYQKVLTKLTLLFLSNPSPLMDKNIKNKQGLKLMMSRSSRYKTSSK